jgi:ABC-type siderophore export system fused ATPase/permease subunit
MALTAMGIGVESAAAAAKGGLTAAKMADYQATMLASGMDKEEIALRTAQILGLYTEAGAEGTATAAKTTGIAALWGKITAGAANIASLVAQTVAQWAFNIAEWAGCPPTIAFALVILILVAALVAVVAVIGLAIAGIIAFVKAI